MKTHRNKSAGAVAAGNTQPISGKGVAAGGQSCARRRVAARCAPRHWPGAGCVAVGGVAGSQRCHSKPGEPGRARSQLGERLARRQHGSALAAAAAETRVGGELGTAGRNKMSETKQNKNKKTKYNDGSNQDRPADQSQQRTEPRHGGVELRTPRKSSSSSGRCLPRMTSKIQEKYLLIKKKYHQEQHLMRQ